MRIAYILASVLVVTSVRPLLDRSYDKTTEFMSKAAIQVLCDVVNKVELSGYEGLYAITRDCSLPCNFLRRSGMPSKFLTRCKHYMLTNIVDVLNIISLSTYYVGRLERSAAHMMPLT